MRSCCKRTAACSRSLMVILPPGLSAVTTWRASSCGRGARQAVGRWSAVKKTPPSPVPQASVAPMTRGSSGMISPRRVGRRDRSFTKSSNVWRWDWRWRSTRTRDLVATRSPNCNALKRPALPGMPAAAKRSSPRTRCHLFTLTRLRCLSVPRRVRSRSWRCSGSSMVCLTVSTIQPRIVLRVVQAPSALRSFLMEIRSSRVAGALWLGSRTLSTTWKRSRRAACR